MSNLSPKKYSAHEIDEMRDLLARLFVERNMKGVTRANGEGGYGVGVPFIESERAEQVERELRTHMLNGTTVKELEERLTAERVRLHREMGITP